MWCWSPPCTPKKARAFVSANLASILAKAGKNVALVDFDMHKPRVHTTWVLPTSGVRRRL